MLAIAFEKEVESYHEVESGGFYGTSESFIPICPRFRCALLNPWHEIICTLFYALGTVSLANFALCNQNMYWDFL